MAKNHTWDGNVLTFNLPDEAVTLDIAALGSEIVQKMVQFAAPTLLRNATAGLLNEDPEKAAERVKARVAAWMAGQWSAKGEASAEPRTSILARALAEVLGIEAKDAAARIEAAVEKAVEATGLDADSDDDDEKAKVKAVGTAVRKQLREASEVAEVYKRLRDEAAAKTAAAKPAVSIRDLLG